MDFNLKSKFWAGNLYNQFESICQDVDEFVSKDTVKFVENQVQSVGMTVKKLYSNVVQDILPPSGNIVKPKRQLLDSEQVNNSEQVDMWDHVSVTGIRTNSTCINEKQSLLSQGSVHALRNPDASLPIEFDHIMHKPPYTDPSPEAETCLHLREHGDTIIQNGEDSSAEDNIRRDLVPVSANPSSDNEMLSGTPDEDHKSSALTLSSSPAFSAHGEGLTTIKNEGRAFKHENGNNSFSDDAKCVSDISSTGCSFESKLLMVEEPYSDHNGSLSLPPAASAHKVNEDNSLLMDSPLPCACDADARDLVNDRALCDSNSTKYEGFDVSTSEHVFSYEKEEMGVMPSSCRTSPKSYSIMESTSEDIIGKAENVLHSHSEADGCAYNNSTPSSITAADETEAVEVLPVSSILESDDNNACQTDGSEYLIGLSESRHERQCEDVYSEIVICPSEAGNTYEVGVRIGDLDTETVDNVMHFGRSVVLNRNLVRAASHRRRNFRYYKNLIQDALTSRKRLSKEYEHLAILYGDIDMESSQNFESSSPPSFPNLAVNAVRTQSSQEIAETDWELL